MPKPSPFQGCWDRIERANRQRDTLLKTFKGLSPEEVYHLPIHVNSKGAGFVMLELKPLPIGLALQFGEVLYQLRAALDGAIYAAAILETGQDPPTDQEHLEFPVRLTHKEFSKAGWHLGPLLNKPVATIVESVQPYHATKITDNGIGILNDLARKDRHRRLHIVAGWPTDIGLEIFPHGCDIVSQSSSFTGGLDGENKVLSFQLSGYDPSTSQLDVHGKFIFHIGINEVPAGTILDLTRIMAGAVSDAVKRIEDCF